MATQKTFAAGSKFPPTTPGKLRLYSMRFCPYAQRARLVLAHKNIPFETVNIHLKKKPDWFVERNPFGTVPVLEKDDQIIYESTATMDWLDEVYPNNKLVPSDPYRKAWDRICLENYGKITSSFYALLTAEDPEKISEKHLESMFTAYQYYENILKQRGGPFFGGDKPCMLDFHMWPIMERISAIMSVKLPKAVVDKEKYPLFGGQWHDAMYSLPAVKATMFDSKTHLEFIKGYLQNPMDPDYDVGLEQ